MTIVVKCLSGIHVPESVPVDYAVQLVEHVGSGEQKDERFASLAGRYVGNNVRVRYGQIRQMEVSEVGSLRQYAGDEDVVDPKVRRPRGFVVERLHHVWRIDDDPAQTVIRVVSTKKFNIKTTNKNHFKKKS